MNFKKQVTLYFVSHALVARFGASQVRYKGAKFGASFTSPIFPINAVIIDSEGVLHGYHVVVARYGKYSESNKIREFAESMKGIMRVHIAKIRSMGDPIIIDLN